MHKDTKAHRPIDEASKTWSPSEGSPASLNAKDHLTDDRRMPRAGPLADKDDNTVSPGSG